MGINACKHLDHGEEEYVTLNINDCALGAILKTIVNYQILKGNNNVIVNGFLSWCAENLDPEKYNINKK